MSLQTYILYGFGFGLSTSLILWYFMVAIRSRNWLPFDSNKDR